MNAEEEHRAIGLVHESLSTGQMIVYNPDHNGKPTEWIRSDTWVEIGT